MREHGVEVWRICRAFAVITRNDCQTSDPVQIARYEVLESDREIGTMLETPKIVVDGALNLAMNIQRRFETETLAVCDEMSSPTPLDRADSSILGITIHFLFGEEVDHLLDLGLIRESYLIVREFVWPIEQGTDAMLIQGGKIVQLDGQILAETQCRLSAKLSVGTRFLWSTMCRLTGSGDGLWEATWRAIACRPHLMRGGAPPRSYTTQMALRSNTSLRVSMRAQTIPRLSCTS